MMIKAKKISAGNYTYTNGVQTVEVIRVPANPAFGDTHDMWIAVAAWDRSTYTDPLYTKWEAVKIAKNWLE